MQHETALGEELAADVIGRIEELILGAEAKQQPLEVEPTRSRLFELFVVADGAGGLEEDAEPDLTCDAISGVLSKRWQLAGALRDSMSQQTRLEESHLSRMRLLWSFMRMWMEWTYAWQRWDEFHRPAGNADSEAS